MRLKGFISIFLIIVGFLWSVTLMAQLSPGDLIDSHAHLEGLSNCVKCHDLGKGVIQQKCLDCHKELDDLVSSNRGYHASKEVLKKACIDCHSDHHGRNFKSIQFNEKSFNHKLAGYELKGAHQQIDCRACHKTELIKTTSLKKKDFTWMGLEKDCMSCHADFHQQTLPENCLDCHTMNSFEKAPLFDHAKTNFQLTNAHEQVDCLSCHPKSIKNGNEFQEFAGIEHGKCTDCHQDVHDGKLGNDCRKCHNTISFAAIWDNIEFNHNQTDFSLTGMHNNVSCASCHQGKKYSVPTSYDQCMDCHADFHRGQFVRKHKTSDCNDCHDAQYPFSFTTYGIKEHQQSEYFLEGAHMATPCNACHMVKKNWVFSGLGTECKDCHGDAHNNQLSAKYYNDANCTSCHTVDDWRIVNFNHNKTNYKLKGMHAQADCRACHFPDDKALIAGVEFRSPSQNCMECHDHHHGNQFEEDGITDCKRCHSDNKDWNANEFNHRKTKFPLEGRHARIDCSACHKPSKNSMNNYDIEYRIKSFQCADCHS